LESNGLMRTSRCTAALSLQKTKRILTGHQQRRRFDPASSPDWMSAISTLNPRVSQYRGTSRNNMFAQSQLSVPPAPAWIEKMALALSCGPPRRFSARIE